ncbi:hypothetical protein ACFL0X_01960 [Nanoarchaeota archaeon]
MTEKYTLRKVFKDDWQETARKNPNLAKAHQDGMTLFREFQQISKNMMSIADNQSNSHGLRFYNHCASVGAILQGAALTSIIYAPLFCGSLIGSHLREAGEYLNNRRNE